MKRVFVTADYYLPAYKAGGPIMSLKRIVSRLGGEAEFWIFTRDHDLGDDRPFPGLPCDEWIERDGAHILYASPERVTPKAILEAIRHVKPEVIYLNSYFSPISRAVLALRRRGKLPAVAVTLAPRGEFAPSALAQKSRHKSVFLIAAKLAGLHKGVLWQASSEHEAGDIRRASSVDAASIVVVPDPIEPPPKAAPAESRPKVSGEAHFVFLGRIAPVKNLAWGIDQLSKVRGRVYLTVYGPYEDEGYWSLCQEAIERAEPHMQVSIQGPILPDEVHDRLSRAQFLLFPTLGENFGHVVVEALTAGLPVLLSDRTPWRDLQAHDAGWVTPLEDEPRWLERLQDCIDMDAHAYSIARQAAFEYIVRHARANEGADPNRLLFGLNGASAEPSDG